MNDMKDTIKLRLIQLGYSQADYNEPNWYYKNDGISEYFVLLTDSMIGGVNMLVSTREAGKYENRMHIFNGTIRSAAQLESVLESLNMVS